MDSIKWVSVGLRVSKLLRQNVAATTNERESPVDGGGGGEEEREEGQQIYKGGEKLLPNCCMFLSFYQSGLKEMGVPCWC